MEPSTTHPATYPAPKNTHSSIVRRYVPEFTEPEAEQHWSIIDSIAELPPGSFNEDHMAHYMPGRQDSFYEQTTINSIMWVL